MNAGAEKFNIFILAQRYLILGVGYDDIYCIDNRLICKKFYLIWCG